MVDQVKFEKFVPLTKMEELPGGTLMVYGTVTAEEPDLTSEVCDYEKTKPYYQAKVEKMFKLTSAVDGMSPSLMPMREMHQLKSIGAGRSIEFDDINKRIRMGFEVVDPEAILKFRKGVLIGFSQGGDYVGGLVDDPKFAGCKRYVADPQEVSGVDAPCLPSALVEAMKGKTVTLQKAAGGVEEVPLQVDRIDRMERLMESLLHFQKNLLPVKGGSEKAAVGGEESTMKELNKEELVKAAKSMSGHLDRLKEMHDDHHAKLADHIEKCMKCFKEFTAGDGAEKTAAELALEKAATEKAAADKAAADAAVAKAAADAAAAAKPDARLDALEKAMAALAKSNEELLAKLAKMPAAAAAHTGATDPMDKVATSSAAKAVPAGYEDLIQTVTH